MKMFLLSMCMLGVCFLSTSATTPFISGVYQADGDHHLTRISVDDNNLFVGGKNILLNLSEDLEELQPPYRTFGPVTESYGENCKGPRYGDGDCSSRHVDNTVSVLVVHPSGQILVCGSALQGLCSVHSKSNISDKSYLPHDTDDAFFRESLLGSHEGNQVVIVVDQNDTNIHYVARGFEKKPAEFHSHIFSVLELKQNRNSYYMRDNIDWGTEGRAYMNLNRSYEGNFTMDMVFGFKTMDYIFFIFNRNPEPYTDTLEARIARINRSCSSEYFQTYIELPIMCNYENTILEKQSVLSGHLHVTPDGSQILFLAFYNPITQDSSVCAYGIHSLVDENFHIAKVHCQNGFDDIVHQPIWVSHTNKLCSVNDHRVRWPKCGEYNYRGLATNEYPFKTNRMIFMEKQRIETIYVSHFSQDQKPVVLLGTSDGFLYKVQVSSHYNSTAQSRQYATYDLSGDRSVPIEKSQGVDSIKQHVYFLVDNKVMKISLFSCGIHTDCDSCVTSLDPLRCGWCGDHCTTQNDCTEYPWYNQACPPEIYKISPLNGTTDGHTKVTILGRYFDSGGGNLDVFIGATECLKPVYNTSSIVCETGVANRSDNASVVVKTSNSTHAMQSITNSTTFEYLIPSFDDFHPKHAPRSGFTSLTLTGQNLDIGSSLTIDVSDSQSVCELESKENDNIVCQLTRWTSTNSGTDTNQSMPASCLGYGPVMVYIDGTALSSNEGFCYMDDPVITSIAPVSTTIGGGRIVSVTGQHFDAISMSSLNIVVRSNESNIELASQECVVVSPSLLLCTYPSLATRLTSVPSGVSGSLTLLLDGGIPVTNAHRRIMVYNDPVLYRVTHNISFDSDDRKMVLHGLYLNMAFGASDYNVTVDGIRCPVIVLEKARLECDMSAVLANLGAYRDKVYQVQAKVGSFLLELGDLNITVYMRLPYVASAGYQNWIWAGIAFVSLFILVTLCVIVRSRRRSKWRRRDYVTNNDMEGAMTFQNLMRIETDEPSSVPNNYISIGHEDGAVGGEPANLFVDLGTIDMLQKQNLLVSRDNLILGESLGHGQFGCVYKGYLSKPGGKGEELVAVKTILKSSSAKEVDIGEFINEALIMKDFNHPNVLSLIGVCIDKGEFPLVILPFMENGDLLAYIRDEKSMPLVKELVFFGLDIAEGMEYLASIKFVHRDLAARNCMLDEQFIARVADFGLSRDIYSSHYYSSDNKKKLPVKWMAPESLEKGKYSAKSDVWSFGVVLWELITRGANPYAAVDNWDMYKFLKDGRRLPKPPFCPPRLFHMMESCWEFNPSRRPTFRDIIKEIKRLLKESEQEENSICDVTVDLESATVAS